VDSFLVINETAGYCVSTLSSPITYWRVSSSSSTHLSCAALQGQRSGANTCSPVALQHTTVAHSIATNVALSTISTGSY